MPIGLPHSTFLSWSPEDQDKALAFRRADNETCPECGTRESDWIDPATGLPYYPPRWEAITMRDFGCEAIESLRARLPEKMSKHGLRVVVVPFDPDREDDLEAWADSQHRDEPEPNLESADAG